MRCASRLDRPGLAEGDRRRRRLAPRRRPRLRSDRDLDGAGAWHPRHPGAASGREDAPCRRSACRALEAVASKCGRDSRHALRSGRVAAMRRFVAALVPCTLGPSRHRNWTCPARGRRHWGRLFFPGRPDPGEGPRAVEQHGHSVHGGCVRSRRGAERCHRAGAVPQGGDGRRCGEPPGRAQRCSSRQAVAT